MFAFLRLVALMVAMVASVGVAHAQATGPLEAKWATSSLLVGSTDCLSMGSALGAFFSVGAPTDVFVPFSCVEGVSGVASSLVLGVYGRTDGAYLGTSSVSGISYTQFGLVGGGLPPDFGEVFVPVLIITFSLYLSAYGIGLILSLFGWRRH